MLQMGKIKRPKKFRYNVDRKKENKKKKRQHAVENQRIKAVWTDKRSAKQNFDVIGLAYDSNAALKKSDKEKSAGRKESAVVKQLMADAANKAPAQVHMSESDALFCAEMMQKYGEDYQAMCRDPDNVYQLTKKQLANLIKKYLAFKASKSR